MPNFNVGQVAAILNQETEPTRTDVLWGHILNPSFPNIIQVKYYDDGSSSWLNITDPTRQYWLRAVLDNTLTTPPGSPNVGDRYIIAAGATGAWAGQDDKVAEWQGSWIFETPLDGYIVNVTSQSQELEQYEGVHGAGGSWATLDFTQPFDGSLYQLKDQKDQSLGYAGLDSSGFLAQSVIDSDNIAYNPASPANWPGGTDTKKKALDHLILQIGGGFQGVSFVADIPARDALSPGTGQGAYVTDASADPAISFGAAFYVYDSSTWQLISAVAAIGSSLDAKSSVQLATTADITLSGEQTIDGVITSTSRVLVKDQADQTQNGIYVTSAGAWSRSLDADSNDEVTAGMYCFIEEGTQADGGWILTTDDPVDLGISLLVFEKFANTPATFLGLSDVNSTQTSDGVLYWDGTQVTSSLNLVYDGDNLTSTSGTFTWENTTINGTTITTVGNMVLTSTSGNVLILDELLPQSSNIYSIGSDSSVWLQATVNSLQLGGSGLPGTQKNITVAGTEANINIDFSPQGTGVLTVPAGYETNVTVGDDIPNTQWVDDNYSNGEDYVSINSAGTLPNASGTDALAIGEDAVASGTQGIAIGQGAVAASLNSIAIGGDAGDNTTGADGTTSITIGVGANSTAAQNIGATSIAIGASAHTEGLNAIAIGNVAIGASTGSIAIGVGAESNAANAYAIGTNAGDNTTGADGAGSISFGNGANSDGAKDIGADSIAIGTGAVSVTSNSIAIGTDAAGTSSSTIGTGYIAIGNQSQSTSADIGQDSIAIGFGTIASATGSVAIGDSANSTAQGAFMLAYHSTAVTNDVTDSFALGWDEADPSYWIAAGNGRRVQTTDATVTTAATLTLDDETVYHIEAIVTCRDQAGTSTERAFYRFEGLFYREAAGSATQQGSTSSLTTVETTGSMDAVFDTDTNDVRVRVTGIAATTLNWRVVLKFNKIT